MSDKKFVVVCTDSQRRGVFGGHLISHDEEKNTVVLEKAQMAIYWSADVHGVLGLAATGPTHDCRIGPPVPRLALNGMTAVMDASDQALDAWKSQPWKS